MLLCPHFAWIAQLVEHFPEEEGVPGSSPGPSTTKSTSGNIVARTLLVSLVARFNHTTPAMRGIDLHTAGLVG